MFPGRESRLTEARANRDRRVRLRPPRMYGGHGLFEFVLLPAECQMNCDLVLIIRYDIMPVKEPALCFSEAELLPPLVDAVLIGSSDYVITA